MSDPAERKIASPSPLAAAIRDVKNATADREDVVVELREAQRTRLELLAAELEPVFAEVPDDAGFDFAISSGLQPRLWIDAVSHVTMVRDRRTYRFLKDTRQGRVVLAESLDIRPVADQVTRYVAERLIERQRLIEGDVQAASPRPVAGDGGHREADAPTRWQSFLSGMLLLLAGAAVGLIVAGALFWDRLAALGIGF